MILPSRLLGGDREGVGVHLLYCDRVPRCASDGIILAVIFGAVAGVNRSAISLFTFGCDLDATIRSLPGRGQTLHWQRWRIILRFFDIELPCSKRFVWAKGNNGNCRQNEKCQD